MKYNLRNVGLVAVSLLLIGGKGGCVTTEKTTARSA